MATFDNPPQWLPNPAEGPIAQPGGGHHLKNLRPLVREAVGLRRGQKADVVVMPEVPHERVDEVRCGDCTPGPVLGWDRDVRAWAGASVP